jgi:hypothetical protein
MLAYITKRYYNFSSFILLPHGVQHATTEDYIQCIAPATIFH